MPLTAPNLDDRTFKDLVDEARQRIPRYTPEWTNFNDSDPGMTLVKLQAWLTETILYRLNKLPDLNYIKFLDMLNIQSRAAVAAQSQLTFKLKKLNDPRDPLVVLIPKNTQVGVDDPDLQEELIFETDRTLTALNASLAMVIVPGAGAARVLVTEYNADSAETKFPHPFYPFGESLGENVVCLLGIIVRPFRKNTADYSLDRFPEGELDLTAFIPEVFEENAEQVTIQGPKSLDCLFPWEAQTEAQRMVWEAYYGTEPETHFTDTASRQIWRSLNVHDETAGLTRSGHLYLEVSGGMPTVPFEKLSRSFWTSLSLTKPPTTSAELAQDIDDGTLPPEELDESIWQDLGISGDDLTELLGYLADPVANRNAIVALIRGLSLNFNAVPTQVWLDASDSYDESPMPYALTWFRARLHDQDVLPEEPPQVSRFLLNTVSATAAVTRYEEILGTSDGRPSQTFRLRRTPLLMNQDSSPPQLELILAVRLGDVEEVWNPVSDFYGQRPDDPVFVVDYQNGIITMGDNIHGQIPIASAQIVAVRYRYGGGSIGNAGPGTITALKSVTPNVDSVTNVRAASGGANAESLAEAMLRAPHDLRHRDRAVTAQDFADLAMQTAGVRIQRAYALPQTRVNSTVDPPALVTDQPGAVTIVILPENREATPQPTEDQLRLVCEYLNQRRLITTELYVVGPRYLTLTELSAEIMVSRQTDLKQVHGMLKEKLLSYFHPLRGNEDHRGWPFGQDIYYGHVYRQLLTVPEVTRVQCLVITPPSGTESCDDFISVPHDSLIHLPDAAINLKVSYDTFG